MAEFVGADESVRPLGVVVDEHLAEIRAEQRHLRGLDLLARGLTSVEKYSFQSENTCNDAVFIMIARSYQFDGAPSRLVAGLLLVALTTSSLPSVCWRRASRDARR